MMSNPNQDQSFEDAFDEFAADDDATHAAADLDASDDAGDDAGDLARDDQGRFTGNGLDADLVDGPDGEQHGREILEGADQADPLAELERYKREAQDWQHRYQSDLGRQAALQRRIQEQQAEIQALQQRSVEAQPGANPTGSGMTDGQWDSLVNDFPEIAAALEVKLSAERTQYQTEIAQLRSQLQPIQETAHRQYINAQYAALDAEHPDWREAVRTPDFSRWLSRQPANVQQLAASDEAADAAYLVRNYKLETGTVQASSNDLRQRRERQLQQARTIPSRGGRGRSNLPPADDFEASFDYFASR